MSSIKFSAPLEPVPFPRPASNGKRRFNPPRYSEFKQLLGWHARNAMHGQAPFYGMIKLFAEFFKLKPKNIMSRNWGDLDNHVKAVLDALNGIAFVDDRQVIAVTATKNFGVPHIVIGLEEI